MKVKVEFVVRVPAVSVVVTLETEIGRLLVTPAALLMVSPPAETTLPAPPIDCAAPPLNVRDPFAVNVPAVSVVVVPVIEMFWLLVRPAALFRVNPPEEIKSPVVPVID